jgi:hypothetical protein
MRRRFSGRAQVESRDDNLALLERVGNLRVVTAKSDENGRPSTQTHLTTTEQ